MRYGKSRHFSDLDTGQLSHAWVRAGKERRPRSWIGILGESQPEEDSSGTASENRSAEGSPRGSLEAAKRTQPEVGGPGTDSGLPSPTCPEGLSRSLQRIAS